MSGLVSVFGDPLTDYSIWRLDNVQTGEYAHVSYDRTGTLSHPSRDLGSCVRYLPTLCHSSAGLSVATVLSPSRAARFG